MKWDSRTALSTEATATLAGVLENDMIDVTNVMAWNNAPYFYFTDTTIITDVTLTDESKVAIDANALTQPALLTEAGTLVLPATGTNGSTIVWTTDSALINVTTGAVTMPEEGQVTVTLTATLTLNAVTEVVTFDILVGVSTVTATTETFETNIGTSYANGTFTGVNGVVWTYVHARNEDTFAITGTGIMLRRSDEPSSLQGVFTSGLNAISFEYRKAYTGATARTYSVDVTNNGTTNTHVIEAFGSGSGAQETVYTFSLTGLNLTGETTVKIYATGPTGNQQAVFDNFIWS
jgi:hypothetical protein